MSATATALAKRIENGSYADRLRLAAGLLDDAGGATELRGMLLAQRAALIAGDVSTGLYKMLGEHLRVGEVQR